MALWRELVVGRQRERHSLVALGGWRAEGGCVNWARVTMARRPTSNPARGHRLLDRAIRKVLPLSPNPSLSPRVAETSPD